MSKSKNASADGSVVKSDVKTRRSERNRLVSKLGEMGSPWASGAQAANIKVNKLEDDLDGERTTLMAILRRAKIA